MLLHLPLQFFAEDTGANAGGGDSQADADNSHVNDNKDGESANPQHQKENFIPKSRFDEVNNKFKEVQAQLDSLLKERQEQELEEQKKRGEYEKLYESTKKELEAAQTYKERAKQLESVIAEMVESKLAEIPEELHDIIPDGMTPEQKLSWITKAQAKGLFGTQKQEENPKESLPLGENTNGNNDKHIDISKMSAMELFLSAYGRKK
ncbi:hypothetical protein P9695_08795 [Weizmannia sp. CD-2023]|uniref:hypothetical protein n=1 Tax=Heyndrickxia TaxID=2837504 RepID=UPI002E204670|nr:hypothetical protein [Weizmannia sp. CD-2023]MED4899718.1 hypothetical protein [Weizmannia sp. CD-2023]